MCQMRFTNKRANYPAAAAADEESPTTGGKRRKIELQQEPEPSIELQVESDHFPSDIVIGILSRLPVKALLRFKSVCTNWAAMIPTDRHLVSMHLKNYTNNPATKSTFLCHYALRQPGTFSSPRKLVSLCSDDQPPPINVDKSVLERIICDTGITGMFLLGDQFDSCPDYRLWNPATRETRLLPDPPPETLCSGSKFPPGLLRYNDSCGVGVDLVANDVKVVLVRHYAYCDTSYNYVSSPKFPSPVFVYSLQSNCWRQLSGRSCNYPYEQGRPALKPHMFTCHTYSDGFIYWLFKDDAMSSVYVVAFDVGNDLFHKINCPFDDAQRCKLGLYRDSVALFRNQSNCRSCEVWLLSRSTNDDERWSWIKHSSLLGPFMERLVVIGCRNDDRLIGRTVFGGQLVMYDTGRRKIQVLVSEYPETIRWHIYKQSLL